MTEHVTDCPKCGRQGKRYENASKGVYYCFRCGDKGRLAQSQRVLDPEALYPSWNMAGKALSLPPNTVPMSYQAMEYISNRLGVPPEIWEGMTPRIDETEKGLLFTFPGEAYWQERRWEKWAPPRWVNPKEAPTSKKEGLMYYIKPEGSTIAVVTEGIFDALKVRMARPDVTSACCLGWPPNGAQLWSLSWIHDKIIIIPDEDVDLKSQLSVARELQTMPVQSLILKIPHVQDPASTPLRDLEDWLGNKLCEDFVLSSDETDPLTTGEKK